MNARGDGNVNIQYVLRPGSLHGSAAVQQLQHILILLCWYLSA